MQFPFLKGAPSAFPFPQGVRVRYLIRSFSVCWYHHTLYNTVPMCHRALPFLFCVVSATVALATTAATFSQQRPHSCPPPESHVIGAICLFVQIEKQRKAN